MAKRNVYDWKMLSTEQEIHWLTACDWWKQDIVSLTEQEMHIGFHRSEEESTSLHHWSPRSQRERDLRDDRSPGRGSAVGFRLRHYHASRRARPAWSGSVSCICQGIDCSLLRWHIDFVLSIFLFVDISISLPAYCCRIFTPDCVPYLSGCVSIRQTANRWAHMLAIPTCMLLSPGTQYAGRCDRCPCLAASIYHRTKGCRHQEDHSRFLAGSN